MKRAGAEKPTFAYSRLAAIAVAQVDGGWVR